MMHNRDDMKFSSGGNGFGIVLKTAAAVFLSLLACCAPATPPSADLRAPNLHQQVFATPEAAVDALVAATRNDDKAALARILGPRAEKLIHSGDRVADKENRERFLAAYDKAHEIENESNGRYVLTVGDEEWPMPFPLARASGGWWFDTATGEQEILNRRIGRNELNVIEICRTYVEAQQEFAATHPIGAAHEYAQRFHSHDGQHDGLYWPAAAGETESPFGPLIASATAEGYSDKTLGKRAPYQGYFYRILKSQGPHASGGAKNYVVNGRMTGGFALIAFPARYGDSGVMSFIVGRNGIVYEKNLGRDTARIARNINRFDPDNSWSIVR